MSSTFNIKSLCHVNTNEDGDRFVGLKYYGNKMIIHFPLGYQLSNNDKAIRMDIRHLINIISIFGYNENEISRGNKHTQNHMDEFPIQAYIDILDYFIDNNGNYYKESEKKLKTALLGKIKFKSTTKHQKGIIYNNNLFYNKFDVEIQAYLDNQIITLIHKFCVYEAYKKLGWLYLNHEIPDPCIKINKRLFIHELQKKYNATYNEKNKRLFKSMKTIIEYIDDRIMDKSFYYGTDNFEYIWEKLIDKIFGISNKEQYFPNAEWIERYGVSQGIPTHALMPDTIMVYTAEAGKNKIYILDAKYYRYGDTCKKEHLPESTSINKQITYGDYAELKYSIPNDSLFNAFIMPYNMQQNVFGKNQKFLNVAEAYGKWRSNEKNYERIQCILVDVKYLINNYLGNHEKDKEDLAKTIEQYLTHRN